MTRTLLGLTFVAALLTSTASEGKVVYDKTVLYNDPFFAWRYEYANVRYAATGYNYNVDAYYVASCIQRLAAIPTPVNHTLSSSTNRVVVVAEFRDYNGNLNQHAYIDCKATFINQATDCVHNGQVYGPGETRLENQQNLIDCVNVSTTYACEAREWRKVRETRRVISQCIPR